MKMKKKKLKKRNKKAMLGESFKHKLIFKTRNSWNSRLGFNREAYFSINLMLKDETENNIVLMLSLILINKILFFILSWFFNWLIHKKNIY
jgi:hypothetical protein